MAELTDHDLREHVRTRYSEAALRMADRDATSGCGCGCKSTEAGTCCGAGTSLGCGVPTAVAELRKGETVLDLGSGAGTDVLISARRVGPTGRAIGIDMTDEMLQLARANAADAEIANVEFVKGYLEELPFADASVDVVISNCVINLAADKTRVLREAARVLRPGGRFAVSDVIADPDMNAATRADMEQGTGCVAGALTRADYERALAGAGLSDIDIRETHRVPPHASAAIVRARKP